MTMREHMHDVHKRLAEHHVKKAKFHKSHADHLRTLVGLSKTENTEANADAAGTLAVLADEHEEMSAEHADLAEHHLACCKSLKESHKESHKAAGMNDGDGDELAPLPQGLSRVVPTHVRPVLRPGQRELPRDMDPAVAKVLGLGTDEGD